MFSPTARANTFLIGCTCPLQCTLKPQVELQNVLEVDLDHDEIISNAFFLRKDRLNLSLGKSECCSSMKGEGKEKRTLHAMETGILL